MILPHYQQVDASFGPKFKGKWYCAYQEKRGAYAISRYLHPKGWKLMCYYWETKKDAEVTFHKVGQTPLPISDREIQEQNNMEEGYRDMDLAQFSTQPPQTKAYDPFDL